MEAARFLHLAQRKLHLGARMRQGASARNRDLMMLRSPAASCTSSPTIATCSSARQCGSVRTCSSVRGNDAGKTEVLPRVERETEDRRAAALAFLDSQRSEIAGVENISATGKSCSASVSPLQIVASRIPPVETTQRAVASRGPSATQSAFERIYDDGEWLCGETSRSGLGSSRETTAEFCRFFENFLRENQVTSVIDAGCGHWPSGYQRFLDWSGVHYHGVEVVPSVVKDNVEYLSNPKVLQSHGLASAKFTARDVSEPLPGGDVLLVKDVLMHLPNSHIQEFLRHNVDEHWDKYRMIVVVQNAMPKKMNLRQVMDIEPGQLLPFDISQAPFNAPFSDIFQWESDQVKLVQLLARK